MPILIIIYGDGLVISYIILYLLFIRFLDIIISVQICIILNIIQLTTNLKL